VALRIEDIDLSRDRALVEAWQAGDRSAFDELYRLYFDRVRDFCQRRVNDHTEAEEIAQEAFVKALQALPRFSGERRFYPWMTVIAGRLCVDHHRRRARVQPSDEVDPGSFDDGVDERLALGIDLAHLDLALRRLGPRHREVLDLREREGLSYNEIAASLDVPHSTVEALLFRARRALRKEFHLVSADRLAGVPLLGWLTRRLVRARTRLAESGIDLAHIGAPLAAGAMTALLILPGGGSSATGPEPLDSTRVAVRPSTTLVEVPIAASLPAPPHTHAVAAPPPSPARAPIAGLTPMTDVDARNEAAQMPLQLALGELGAGLDTTPLIDTLASPATRETP
jgi:RNA polymerase sigma-70 factor (ECF subfamily)